MLNLLSNVCQGVCSTSNIFSCLQSNALIFFTDLSWDCVAFPFIMVCVLCSSNEETVLSAITTLIYITTPDSKKGIDNFFQENSDLQAMITLCYKPSQQTI